MTDQEKFMKMAIKEAKKGLALDEVPVGAVLVVDGVVVAKGYNKRESKRDALAHAEIICIQKACKKFKDFRLTNAELYVTLEPCLMCFGAILNARIKKVYFGASDLNYGCCGSKYNFLQDKTFEHLVDVQGEILKDECTEIIKKFFIEIREEKKNAKAISRKNSRS